MIAFIVAGTASGVGKTTAALAIMAALMERGLIVQPFKCGPDFLDAGHHSAICQRPSRNLDTWILDAEANQAIFAGATRGADAAVAEGMMGLFDGVRGGGEAGSTAEIAKLLGLPIVLVIDASKSARSVAAVVKGFEAFDPDLHFAGIVLNGVNSEGHYRLLEDAICSTASIPLLGRIPRSEEITIPERHLGLRTAEEETASEERRSALACTARQHLKLDELLAFTQYMGLSESAPIESSHQRVRVGIARDKAFSFYYEDNLDLMRQFGAEIVPFSPLTDHRLPENLDGLYLGGGYPELYARELSANESMLAGVRELVDSGSPVYAECGGMIYLGQSLRLLDGGTIPMASILPLAFEMTDRLVHFGYVDVEFTQDCLLGPAGTITRGHSFHHSTITGAHSLSTAYCLHYSLSGKMEPEGFCDRSVLASYVHLHFRSNPAMAESFVKKAAQRSRQLR